MGQPHTQMSTATYINCTATVPALCLTLNWACHNVRDSMAWCNAHLISTDSIRHFIYVTLSSLWDYFPIYVVICIERFKEYTSVTLCKGIDVLFELAKIGPPGDSVTDQGTDPVMRRSLSHQMGTGPQFDPTRSPISRTHSCAEVAHVRSGECLSSQQCCDNKSRYSRGRWNITQKCDSIQLGTEVAQFRTWSLEATESRNTPSMQLPTWIIECGTDAMVCQSRIQIPSCKFAWPGKILFPVKYRRMRDSFLRLPH